MWVTLIVQPMSNALLFIYNTLFLNFGLAIIVFTILVRLITHPFTAQQIKSMLYFIENRYILIRTDSDHR